MATVIDAKNVTMQFGGLKALNDISLHIDEGEIVALIGPNGAGKTTMFNAITGFVKKSGGSVIFEGREVGELKAHEIAERGIVRTFQITSVFPNLTVLDNIRTACHKKSKETLLDVLFNTKRKQEVERKTQERAKEIIDFVGLQGKGDAVAGAMPYGEQRILEIAIALAADPSLILLDEPSAGLNDTETQVMKALVRRIREKGITILLVEHDMKLVMGISDQIFVLNFGKGIASGTPAEIRCNPEVIKAYLGEAKSHVGG